MCTIKQINILDMLDMYGEDSCKEILSTFICSLNMDVDDFIHNNAINFAKQRIAITFLVFRETEKGNVLTGYYTLANKFVAVSADMLSTTLKKRISKFSQYDAVLDRYLISMPLIAQLGRNYSDIAQKYPISGNDLLDLACQNIQNVQHIIVRRQGQLHFLAHRNAATLCRSAFQGAGGSFADTDCVEDPYR